MTQDTTTGQLAYANMTGGTFQGWVAVGGVPGYTAHTEPGTSNGPMAVTASDPGTGSLSGLTMSDPGTGSLSGLTMSDPGTGNVSGLTMSDPAPGSIGPISMFDSGPATTSNPLSLLDTPVPSVLHAGA